MNKQFRLVDKRNLNDAGVGLSVWLTFMSADYKTTVERCVKSDVADGFTIGESYEGTAIFG